MAVGFFNRAVARLRDMCEKLESGQDLTEKERRRVVMDTFIGAGFCFLARDGLECVMREEDENGESQE